MTRRDRQDGPDTWHHVMIRGIARRPVFEDRRQARGILALFALAVRSGTIEIHCYCVLGTHFHFLVRSVKGKLSGTMCEILKRYARWFNRSHRRDGPLFRGRFTSKPVLCERYRLNLIRYIEQNPSHAGLQIEFGGYEFSSARHWISGRFPPWFETNWIDEILAQWSNSGTSRAALFENLFGSPMPASIRRWVERYQCADALTSGELGLYEGATPEVKAWMIRKARLADGTSPGAPLADLPSVAASIADYRTELLSTRPSVVDKRLVSLDEVLGTALARHLCGLRVVEAASALEVSPPTVTARCRRHLQELTDNPAYAELAAIIAREALARFASHTRVSPSSEAIDDPIELAL